MSEDVEERGGGVEIMVGRREEEEEELERRAGVEDVGVGRNDAGVIPVLDEIDELDKDEGIPWLVGGLVIGGDFPRRVGGIILGASSVGSSLPRTFSAMRNIARANCSAFNLPFFCVSQRFLQERENIKPYQTIDYIDYRNHLAQCIC